MTHYGNSRCVDRLGHEYALKEAVDKGAEILRRELENFLMKRRRDIYIKAMRIASHGARWPDIKNELDINDKALSGVLKALSDAFIVEKRDGL